MTLNKLFIGCALAVSTSVLAAQPAPVIDVSSSSANPENLSSVERQLNTYKKRQVVMQRQLDELQNEVSELRGITELHSHQLGQILERQRELYQELDRRVSEALKPANQVPANLAAPAGSQNTGSYSASLTENEAYDRAVNLVLKEKQYDKAIPEFRAFNQQFPQSSYAANAHYWLGQLLFNKGELAEAATEFAIVVEQFQDSNKRADALLKLGMVAQKQGQKGKAVSMYQQLVSEYPTSTAAKLGQSRLSSLQP